MKVFTFDLVLWFGKIQWGKSLLELTYSRALENELGQELSLLKS